MAHLESLRDTKPLCSSTKDARQRGDLEAWETRCKSMRMFLSSESSSIPRGKMTQHVRPSEILKAKE